MCAAYGRFGIPCVAALFRERFNRIGGGCLPAPFPPMHKKAYLLFQLCRLAVIHIVEVLIFAHHAPYEGVGMSPHAAVD